MAWTTPASYATNEVLASSKLNTHVRDNLRYLKGLDGAVTVESTLIVSGVGVIQGGFPVLRLSDTDGPTNAKNTDFVMDNGALQVLPINDAASAYGTGGFTATRSGNAFTAWGFGAPLHLTAGAAAAPALVGSGATGEGLYWPGGSTLAFATGFTERLTLAAGSAVLNTHWNPKTNNVYSLGNTSLRWAECWVQAGAFNTSDVREKEGFCLVDPRDALAACLATPVYEFAYRGSDRRSVSFIAQEAHPLFSHDGLTAEAQRTATVAVAAIRALDARLRALEGAA